MEDSGHGETFVASLIECVEPESNRKLWHY